MYLYAKKKINMKIYFLKFKIIIFNLDFSRHANNVPRALPYFRNKSTHFRINYVSNNTFYRIQFLQRKKA